MLALLALHFSPSSMAEQSIAVVAAEFPPLTTNAGGQPGGVVREVVREAGKRAGIALEFKFLPWERAQLETQSRNRRTHHDRLAAPARCSSAAKSPGPNPLQPHTSLDKTPS
jgi:hypothetical protein